MTKKELTFIADMKRLRGIDFARIGMMVNIDGQVGTIVGMNDSANIDVVFANQLANGKHKHNCHPTNNVTYFSASGEIVSQFGG